MTWSEIDRPGQTFRKRRRGDSVDTVAEFIQSITENAGLPWDEVVYRGQKDVRWYTQASIFRNDNRLVRFEHEMGRELVSVHPTEFTTDATMFDRLVRMQHYGLPTRLVDVSRNPLVALFFACEQHAEIGHDGSGRTTTKDLDGAVIAYNVPTDRSRFYDSDTVAVLANLANLRDHEKMEIADNFFTPKPEFNELGSVKRLVGFIQSEKPHFSRDIDPVTAFVPMYVKPRLSNKRIIAQAGAFLIYGLEITDTKSAYSHNIKQKYIHIPAKRKASIRMELDRLGINESALFPELNKAADQIVSKYTARHSVNLT
ncbi:FRG domain-containing protein [Ensifer sp. ENS12]|uniref:FRG domain-containing protein n=1 Tax=Ensifer sp. ENS12 TaxID=2854774 RepID=UPI001C493B43|nr:FRG domain-containing protein [Ensifer sp. ENS12]MBV7522626.1 FRG domain-containing protein [Ensifer sp. ENS12]